MKRLIALSAVVGVPFCATALTSAMPKVALILTFIFGGPFIAQIGIGFGVFITDVFLGRPLMEAFILGL